MSCSEAKISVISYWNTRLEPGLSTLCLRGTKATLSFHKIILPREFTWISVLGIAPLNFSFLIGKVETTVLSRLGCWGHKGRLWEVSCDAGLGTRGPCPTDADHSCPGCLEGPALPPYLPSPWVGPESVGSPQVPQECPVWELSWGSVHHPSGRWMVDWLMEVTTISVTWSRVTAPHPPAREPQSRASL